MDLTGWDVVLWIHLLAMATFVGGQLFTAAVVPTYVAQAGRAARAQWMLPIARRLAGFVGALAVLLVTGSMMARLRAWTTAMNVKLARRRHPSSRACTCSPHSSNRLRRS
jgi:uncharacterized membrane protein